MLIEREAALKAVHEAIAEGKSWYSALSRLPSAEWIPCSEQMPEEYNRVLVTVLVDGEREVDTAITGGTYIDGFFDTHIDWDEGNSPHILAWMPLPKPYKEQSNE